jgi:hypothetical protein
MLMIPFDTSGFDRQLRYRILTETNDALPKMMLFPTYKSPTRRYWSYLFVTVHVVYE